MPRDIDYAAISIKTAIVEKYGRKSDLHDLDVTAKERTISIRDGARMAHGTRDELHAVIRAADTYASLWELLPMDGPSDRQG